MKSHLIASRQGRPANDPIFALSKQAAERRASGADVINATLGVLLDEQGKLAMLETATRALREVPAEQVASYAPIAGPPEFLEAVKREVTCGRPSLLARAVAVGTTGGTGALRHAFTTLLEEGEALLTTSFFWGPYSTIAAEHGRSVKTFSMFRPDGAFDAEALGVALSALLETQGRALVLLNDPCHNPTGYSMSERDWGAVAAVLDEASARGPVSVLLDIAYASFVEGSVERPVAALAGVADKLLVGFCWSGSKTFLLYGQRIGALVLVPPRREQSQDLEASLVFSSRGTWSNGNHAGMVAAARLLADGDDRRAVDAERREASALLDARVRAWNTEARPLGLRYPRYDGGFFVTVSSDDPQRHAAQLRERGVFVVPLPGALRVALCSVPTRDVPRLARAMAEVVGAPAP